MTKAFKKAAALFMAAVVIITSFSACGEQPSAKVTIENNKFTVDGKELWLNGCNTPWYNWNDFTGSMDEEAWEETFAMLAQDNINCTRIWLNCDGQSIVRLNGTGMFYNVVDGHWDDLDKLFALADKYGVYVMATLLSFDHFKSANWQELLKSDEGCDSYAENYVAEFCERYGDNEYLFSIDIINEPDWVAENEECGQIGWNRISYLIGKCAAVIHEKCDVLVTAGIGMIKYNSEKYEGNAVSDEFLKKLTGLDGAYLDFYSPHYYAWMLPHFGCPYTVSPEEFGLETDKPCVMGETSNDNDSRTGLTLSEIYRTMYDNGWDGVLVWMESHFDQDPVWYEYALTAEATNSMADYIYDKIYPIGKKKVS